MFNESCDLTCMEFKVLYIPAKKRRDGANAGPARKGREGVTLQPAAHGHKTTQNDAGDECDGKGGVHG